MLKLWNLLPLQIFIRNLSNHHLRNYRSDSLRKKSLLDFQNIFRRSNFSLYEQKSNSPKSPKTMQKLHLSTKFPHQEIRWNYDIFRSARSWSDRPGFMTPDWLTLSDEFVSIWSIRVVVYLVIICSKECVKQNSKYVLVRWSISLLIVFVYLFLKISLSRTY